LDPAVEARIDIEQAGVKLFIGPRERPNVCSMTGLHRPLHGPQREDL
jgi:hypothetical protein